ncbi:heat shock protein, partial [Thalictrum thalictroides]
MASVLLRSHRHLSSFYSLSGNVKTSLGSSTLGLKWANLGRPFSSRSPGNDIIGIDLGTTNSCVAVMEGK